MSGQCPHCGQPLTKPSRVGRAWRAYAGYRQRHYQVFESSLSPAPWQPEPPPQHKGGYFEATRERPARPMNVESDFVTPLLQAAGVFFFVTLGSLYLAWTLDFAWHLACFVGVATSGLFYLVALAVNRKLLWIAETVINEDLDGDGHVGFPPAPLTALAPLEVLHKDEAGHLRQLHRLNLPDSISQAQLVEFAKGAALKGLAQGQWTGKAGLFSRSEFDALMAELERANIVAWVDPQNRSQGRRLTHPGQAALRYWAEAAQKGA